MSANMQRIRITKEFRFEMAHALTTYDGPCRNIHGHSYGLTVTVSGFPRQDPDHVKNGMVMDYTDLKKIVHEEVIHPLDHALLLHKNYLIKRKISAPGLHDHIVFAEYEPTCENMLLDFVGKIGKRLPDGIRLECIRLRETATSWSEWRSEDNP
jgi:6-pyruvoyltetrahydropterin/6-carboxytetrahydropterin synthase